MRLKKGRFDYKWVILVICFLMEFNCLGFCSSNVGLYLAAITKALDIERSLFSLNSSIRYIMTTLICLGFGTFLYRFGPKKMIVAGFVALFSALMIYAHAWKLHHIYLGGVLLGVGVTFTGSTMVGTIIRRWFHDNVGKFTGIVMSANGIGGAVAAQIISPLINEAGNPFGYRNAYKLSALITLVVGVVVIPLLREKPTETPVVFEKKQRKRPSSTWVGIDFVQAKKKPYFYLSGLMVLLTGISLQSIGSFSLTHMQDVGLSAGFVATAATISSLVLTVSKIFVGAVYDKRGLRTAILVCHLAAIFSFVLKALLEDSALGQVLAIVAEVLASLALPLETVIMPLLVNDLYGDAGYNKVLGVYVALNAVGLCIGSPLGNLCYDLVGTYMPILWGFSALMVAVTVGFQFVLINAARDKQRLCLQSGSEGA